jgi:hypothetical protein
VSQTRCSALLRWIKRVIKDTIEKDLGEVTRKAETASAKLRAERIMLMKEKSSKENDDICISLSFELEQNRNNDRDEIFKDTENKNENEEFSLTDLNDGIQIPSREEIFGKVSELTPQYEEENEKFMKQLNDNKLKVGSKLQDKLDARRQRRAQKYCEEKQISSIIEAST